MEPKQFLVIIEEGPRNYSAYSPDLPGCVATGKTLDELKKNMVEAIQFHLEGLKKENMAIPVRQSRAEYLEVAFA